MINHGNKKGITMTIGNQCRDITGISGMQVKKHTTQLRRRSYQSKHVPVNKDEKSSAAVRLLFKQKPSPGHTDRFTPLGLADNVPTCSRDTTQNIDMEPRITASIIHEDPVIKDGSKWHVFRDLEIKKAQHHVQCLDIITENKATGGRDKGRQIETITQAFHDRYGSLPKADRLILKMPPLNSEFPYEPEETLVEELGNNPTFEFSQVHEGVNGTTKMSAGLVIKGYESKGMTEIEQVSTQFMRATDEKTPDMCLASLDLRTQILALDPDYKKADIIEEKINRNIYAPSLFTGKVIENHNPKHMMLMPNLGAINLQNILKDPLLRPSFKASIRAHITEVARIGFKDLIIGNGDRCILLYPGSSSTHHLRDHVAINRGNIMFRIDQGDVVPGTAIAIDNNTLTDYTKDGKALFGIKQTELSAFTHYLSIRGLNAVVVHLIRALKEELDVAKDDQPALVKPKWAQVPELLDGLIDLSDEEQHALIGLSDDQQANILIDKLDKTLESLIRAGFKQGLRQVKDNKRKIDDLLKKEKRNPHTDEAKRFIDVLSEKLKILHRTRVSL